MRYAGDFVAGATEDVFGHPAGVLEGSGDGVERFWGFGFCLLGRGVGHCTVEIVRWVVE